MPVPRYHHRVRKRILATFPDETRYKPPHVLDIPDDYRFMELDLISLIFSAVDLTIESMLQSNPEQPIEG